jgi:hypothetical protein
MGLMVGIDWFERLFVFNVFDKFETTKIKLSVTFWFGFLRGKITSMFCFEVCVSVCMSVCLIGCLSVCMSVRLSV